MGGRNAAPRRVPRLPALLIVLALTFGADAPPYKGAPSWLLKQLWTPQAHASGGDIDLRFAHAYNQAATNAHGPFRVAAIACSPWKAGLAACDVLFVRKATGAFTCAVVAVDPAAEPVARWNVKCPAGVADGGTPKA